MTCLPHTEPCHGVREHLAITHRTEVIRSSGHSRATMDIHTFKVAAAQVSVETDRSTIGQIVVVVAVRNRDSERLRGCSNGRLQFGRRDVTVTALDDFRRLSAWHPAHLS